jgi:hypothetical protein
MFRFIRIVIESQDADPDLRVSPSLARRRKNADAKSQVSS